jgi:hypothetical protein
MCACFTMDGQSVSLRAQITDCVDNSAVGLVSHLNGREIKKDSTRSKPHPVGRMGAARY